MLPLNLTHYCLCTHHIIAATCNTSLLLLAHLRMADVQLLREIVGSRAF